MKKEEIYVVIDDEQKRQRAIQILTDAKEEVLSGSILTGKFHGKATLGIFSKLWQDVNIDSRIEITLDQLEQLLNPKEIKLDALKLIAESYGFELVEKVREIKIGDFGKFWDVKETNYFMGFVKNIRIECAFPFTPEGGVIYRNFRHLTDEEKKAITENW